MSGDGGGQLLESGGEQEGLGPSEIAARASRRLDEGHNHCGRFRWQRWPRSRRIVRRGGRLRSRQVADLYVVDVLGQPPHNETVVQQVKACHDDEQLLSA